MLNNCNFVGRLVNEPELRYYEKNENEGKPYVRFKLAVERDYKDKNGDKPVDYPQFTIFGMNAEACAKHLNKGSLVSVVARYETRVTVDEEGNKNYNQGFNVKEPIQFLANYGEQNNNQSNNANSNSGNQKGNPTEEDDFDPNDIPFEN